MHNLIHNSRKLAVRVLVWGAICSSLFAGQVSASPPAVKGIRSTIDGMRVLRVWGEPHDRGYALGYHFGGEIVALIDAYVSNPASGGREGFDKMVAFAKTRMVIDAKYKAELEGVVDGMRAKLGRDAEVAVLGHPLRYEDLLTFNCLPELAMLGCSSFAVWGDATADRGTLAGRNLDWHALDGLIGSEILVVNAPAEDGSRLGWVSVTWPSFIGCLTGMNSEGVTVSMHDVSVPPPQGDRGFVPRGFALRDAIESAHASTAFEDVEHVLRSSRCAVGNNIPVNRPSRAGPLPAAVFEYDGKRQESDGVTVRRAQRLSYLLCTNHYVSRAKPRACNRYQSIDKRLAEFARQNRPVGLKEAWDILRDVAYQGGDGRRSTITLYSVLFEPDALRMHLKVAVKNRAVADVAPITIDLAEEFKRLRADGPTN